ncbi:MAG TPA: hypothetical protein VLS94_12240 [Fusibacter sp.]|nr:hypothetical protein [Fusibacter sp.]
MATRIDAVQLIAEMEKNAAHLMCLAENMKQAALQVMAEKTFITNSQSGQKEVDENDSTLAMYLEKSIAKFKNRDEKTLFRSAGARSASSAIETTVRDFPSVSKLVNDMMQASFSILKKDITTVGGFTKRQLKGMAELAKMIAIGIKEETLSDETVEYSLGRLKSMPEEFIVVIKKIAELEMEKVWNAIIGVLWNAIETAIGFKLPIPS